MRYRLDQPEPANRALPAAGGDRRRRRLACAAAGLAIGWLSSVGQLGCRLQALPQESCRSNLRDLWVVARKVPLTLRSAEREFVAVRELLGQDIFLTPQEARYLNRGSGRSQGEYFSPGLETLVCPLDPEYGYKIGPALYGLQLFRASYEWRPSPGVLAACPFHHLVVGASNGDLHTLVEAHRRSAGAPRPAAPGRVAP